MNPSETLGYRKRPSLKDKIHCVAFVLNAVKLSTYPESLTSSFQQLREHISELGEKWTAARRHQRPSKNSLGLHRKGSVGVKLKTVLILLSYLPLGVHQVALVTHVDQVCPETAQDVTKVYRSRLVHATVDSHTPSVFFLSLFTPDGC